MPLRQCATRQFPNPRTNPKPRSKPASELSIRSFRFAELFRAIHILVALLVCAAATLCAQQPAPSADRPDAPSATHKPPASMVSTLNRKSLFFPDIATNESRLSTGDKFKLFVDNSASLGTLVWAAASAGIGQAEDFPQGYGQGAEGYGKRFGASMARNASSEFFGTFVLASMLHQDPRFFPQADPTLGGSVKYAVTRVFVTRNDDGNDVANWSGLLGPAMGEGLANAYWPEGERTAGKTLERYGIDIASRAGFNFLRNYWPVMFKKMKHSSHN
jgi:hypothetical protein